MEPTKAGAPKGFTVDGLVLKMLCLFQRHVQGLQDDLVNYSCL